MKVLITGSRAATPAMLQKAAEVVRWCATQGHTVLVGDAPGVDHAVRHACVRYQVACRVYGAYDRVREPTAGGTLMHTACRSYPARDRCMARQCDLCVAIWNGHSHGTRYTADYVRSLGKRVIWRVCPTVSSSLLPHTI